MVRKKKIVILHTINQFKTFHNLEKDFEQTYSTKIFAFTLNLRIFLKSKNINYDIPEKYLSIIQKKKMNDKANRLSQIWHKDKFKFRSISLGSLVQYEKYFYFSRIIRNIQQILSIIEAKRPLEIIAFNSSDSYIKEFNTTLDYICSLKNIPLNLILLEGSTSSNLRKPIQKFKKFENKLFKKLQIFLKEHFFIFLAKLFFILKKIIHKKKKNIFILHPRYHSSIISEFSKYYNVFLRSSQLNKQKLYHNIRNIFCHNSHGYYIFFGAFGNNKINKLSDLYFNILLNKWKMVINEIDFKKTFSYNGIDFWSIIKSEIYKIIFIEFKYLIKDILIQSYFLKKGKYRALILGNDNQKMLKSIVMICSKMKIPTIVIQHGVVAGVVGIIPCISTKFCAWGKICKKILINSGMDEKKIVITGSPRYDIYVKLNRNEKFKKKIKKSVYKDFNIKKDEKLILLATLANNIFHRLNIDRTIKDFEKCLTLPLKVIKNIPNSHLIIKLHPADKYKNFSLETIKLIGAENVSVTKKYNIINLIIACDCFISEESTTVLEALLLQKPIICLKFKDNKYFTPYFKYNIINKATNYEQLINHIKNAIDDSFQLKPYNNILEDYLYKIDGLSTKRVLKLINELVYN